MATSLQDFKASLKGDVFQPTDTGYDLSKWAENAKKKAQFIVLPAEAEDVSKAIKYARANDLPLAIRGGGHGTSGSSATEGLLIDMRKMTAIKVDEASKIAYIQAGARTHDIEVALAKYGLTTTLSVCGEVGIGGYVTAGGIGISSGQYGLACDNLLSATVVLADGTTVVANYTENPDLFWGLRGGGSNYGVVTEVGMKVRAAPKTIYVWNYIFAPQQLEPVVAAFNEWLPTQRDSEGAYLSLSCGPDGSPYVIVYGYCHTSREEGQNISKRWLDIGPVQVPVDGDIPIEDFTNLSAPFNALPGNKLIVGAHFDNMAFETVKKAHELWSEVVKKAPFSAIMYECYPERKIGEVPVESMAYAGRHNMNSAMVLIGWTDDSFTPEARETLLKMKATVSSSSCKEAQEDIGLANYACPFSSRNDTDEYARKLFKSNYPRLQEVKKKYDPDVVFNQWFAIKPAD